MTEEERDILARATPRVQAILPGVNGGTETAPGARRTRSDKGTHKAKPAGTLTKPQTDELRWRLEMWIESEKKLLLFTQERDSYRAKYMDYLGELQAK